MVNVVDVVYEGGDTNWVVARVAQRGTETFVGYTDEHLAAGADLAPIRHPLHDRVRRFSGRIDEDLPGLLSDALPDSWGRSVLRRDMAQHGIERPTQMQMLTWLGRRTMGALTFAPAEGTEPGDVTLVDVDRVQGEVLHHLTGEEAQDVTAAALVLAAGSSPGGARPKIAAAFTADGELVADSGTLPAGSAPWLNGVDREVAEQVAARLPAIADERRR